MAPIIFNVKSITRLDILSDIIGWSYFFVWSISFYPQVFLNWKRKSVRGLSIDFLFYNLLGFFCYSIFNIALYFDKEIRDEYHSRHPNSENNLVRMNDVVFSIHGFIISLFILLQTCVYKKSESQKISSFAASFVWLTIIGSALVISTIPYGGAKWLDFIYYLSFIQFIVSFIKYLPQVWLNYRRKSTQGWSIQYIIWDISGGVLSILQLFLDAYIEGDWSGVEGDNIKLGLGLIAICYDTIFLVQHYILYSRHHHLSSIKQERRRLVMEGNISIEDEGNLDSEASSISNGRSLYTNNYYGSTTTNTNV
ncbi:MAG: PQ loop repeat-domain-containing protein [Benjaminiella poitrasii]|nr:MAG: PQ loop repeat-domain-containing protein [Benjaminiella poitrasii]